MSDAKRILTAEDNPALSSVIGFNLNRAGFAVTQAKNGREALEFARRQQFDLVVTDHQMPEMNGVELATALREMPEYVGVPILMLTAKGLELDRSRLREELDISDALPKPFSPTELVARVHELFATSAAR